MNLRFLLFMHSFVVNEQTLKGDDTFSFIGNVKILYQHLIEMISHSYFIRACMNGRSKCLHDRSNRS